MKYICLRDCYFPVDESGKPHHINVEEIIESSVKLPKHLFAAIDAELTIDFGTVSLEVLNESESWDEAKAREYVKANFGKRISKGVDRGKLASILVDTRERTINVPKGA